MGNRWGKWDLNLGFMENIKVNLPTLLKTLPERQCVFFFLQSKNKYGKLIMKCSFINIIQEVKIFTNSCEKILVSYFT